MLGCRRYRRQLPLWVGGDLDERLALRVRLHVKNCAGCAAAAQSLRLARGRLEQAAAEAVPMGQESLWPQLRPLCRAENPQHADLRGWFPALSLAAACASLLIGVALLPGAPPPRPVRAPLRALSGGTFYGPVSVDRAARGDDGAPADFDRWLLLPDANRYSRSKRGRF